MRFLHRLLAAALVLTLAIVVLATRSPSVRHHGAVEEDEASELLEPGDWMLAQRAGDAAIAPGAYERAIAQAVETRRRTAVADPALAAAQWRGLGPTNIGGRVVDLAIDPADADVVYAATASGGVWKSTDAGVTFAPAWPDDAVQPMGAIAMASDGALFAGTGEANPGGGSSTLAGNGIYRSRDGGVSWTHLGLHTAGAFGRIAVDPSDPSRVFAAAAGNLFVPGGERGLYRSLDGGDSWELVLAGSNERTGAIDVALGPHAIVAAMWDHQRTSSRRIYGGPGSGVYRSTDGGRTWTRTEVAAGSLGRIGVAVAPSDPDRVYATVVNAVGRPVGVFGSFDAGVTWQRLGNLLGQSSFGWWFGRVWVDPVAKDRLFVAGVRLYESTNGGFSFLTSTPTGLEAHADQHAMAWRGNRVYLGNDGGVYRSDANATLGTWTAAVSQGWTQHYSVDVAPHATNVVVSGLQDNLCQRTLAGGLRDDTWRDYGTCGDGLQTLVHPVVDTILYGCAQNGLSCTMSPDGGHTAVPLGAKVSDRFNWWVPMQFDPDNPAVMYAAGNRLNRSDAAGQRWEPISPDLTTNPAQDDPDYRFGTITTVAASRAPTKVLYVGTDDGLVWSSADAGLTWSRSHDPDIPGSWVTRINADPVRAGVAYASFSGYRDGERGAHVLRTDDGGRTWTDISGDLPMAPVNEVVVADDRLVAATDVGVFASGDGGATWLAVGAGLPLVPVMDLSYVAGTLTAATYGRGVMRVALR